MNGFANFECSPHPRAVQTHKSELLAVEEVPSSSASSVAPSAATTPAASKTAASIQEVYDEQEPG